MKNRTQDIHSQMQRFAELTKNFIRTGQIKRARICLAKAESIYLNGKPVEKIAVSNIYIYSISSFMELHNCNIRNLFPKELFQEYHSQIDSMGV